MPSPEPAATPKKRRKAVLERLADRAERLTRAFDDVSLVGTAEHPFVRAKRHFRLQLPQHTSCDCTRLTHARNVFMPVAAGRINAHAEPMEYKYIVYCRSCSQVHDSALRGNL